MRRGIQLAALGVAVVIVVFWLFGGPHFGRSQVQEVPAPFAPDTAEENERSHLQFTPGLDFLLSGVAIAALLYTLSLLAPAPEMRPLGQSPASKQTKENPGP